MSISDETLFRGYLGGNEAAFTQLYSRYSASLWMYLMSIVHSSEAADDLLQDTFLRFHANRTLRLQTKSVKALLFRIGRNLAVSYRRHQSCPVSRASSIYNKDGSLLDVPDLARADNADACNRVAIAMTRLLEGHRTILVSHFVEGGTYRELAKACKVSTGTIRNRLHAAVIQFKEAYEAVGNCVTMPIKGI